MFFSSRKKKKLAEETQALEARLKQEAAILEAHAYSANLETFYKICDMVCSLPKRRQIVVVQRKNVFKSDQERNRCYLELAKEMPRYHKVLNVKWLTNDDNSLYAFYAPTKVDYEFRCALNDFSKDGCLIQRIRYYHFNY